VDDGICVFPHLLARRDGRTPGGCSDVHGVTIQGRITVACEFRDM
jgi:hypothetical protein